MSETFHQGSRVLQDRFDTRRIADRIDELLVKDTIGDGDRAFIEGADCFFLATADAEGRPDCSYKGGDRGFVKVIDERTIAFPNYDGNGMYLSMGNISVNPSVGLLFIDFERGHRMRLNGDASIDLDESAFPWAWARARRMSRTGPPIPEAARPSQDVLPSTPRDLWPRWC